MEKYRFELFFETSPDTFKLLKFHSYNAYLHAYKVLRDAGHKAFRKSN